MKKCLLLFLLLLPGLLSAQIPAGDIRSEEAKLNSLKLYPFAFVKSRFAVSYERALANRWAVQVGLGIVSNDRSDFYEGSDVFGYSADVQLRKYLQPRRNQLEGIYFAPHLGYKTLEFDAYQYNYGYYPSTPDTVKYSSSAINAGLVMGYQVHVFDVVAIDVYGGGGYRHTNPNVHYRDHGGFFDSGPTREYSSKGVYPVLGFQIGVLF